MSRCPNCGRVQVDGRPECPECRTPLNGESIPRFQPDGELDDVVPPHDWNAEDESMLRIARFQSAAEAGYFAHELWQSAAIPALIVTDDNFDALTGYWRTRYVIVVQESSAETAVQVMQSLLEADDEAFDPESSRTADVQDVIDRNDTPIAGDVSRATKPWLDERHSHSETMLRWVPMVLTLAAGSVGFGVGRKLQMPPKPGGPAIHMEREQQLWNQLSAGQFPWVQRLENGRGVRELWIAPQHKLAFIREDVDGDGEFETVLPLHRDGQH